MEILWCRSSRKSLVIVTIVSIVIVMAFYSSWPNAEQDYTPKNLNNGHQRKRLQTRLQNHGSSDTEESAVFSSSMQMDEGNFDVISGHDEDDFMKAQAEIQRKRKRTLQAACEKYSLPQHRNGKYPVTSPNRFIVDTKYKLVYCAVAKVASTNWRLIFEKLAGVVNFDEDATQANINRELKRRLTFMDDLRRSEVDSLLERSLTFMFARHPFSRLLSSYRNKLEPNSTFERAGGWQFWLGKPIMDQYRHGINTWNFRELQSLRKRRVERAKRKLRLRGVYDLKFSEFVRFVSDSENLKNPFYRNHHWSELYQTCSPCSIDFDVIGKLETLEDDVKYILKLAKLDKKVQFPNPKGSSPTYSYVNDTLEHYLRDVPADYIRDLYKSYRVDFEMFGYDLPPIAVKKLEESHIHI